MLTRDKKEVFSKTEQLRAMVYLAACPSYAVLCHQSAGGGGDLSCGPIGTISVLLASPLALTAGLFTLCLHGYGYVGQREIYGFDESVRLIVRPLMALWCVTVVHFRLLASVLLPGCGCHPLAAIVPDARTNFCRPMLCIVRTMPSCIGWV